MGNADVNKPWFVILTHGRFGEELKNSAEMILGKMEHAYAFSLLESMDPKEFIDLVKEEIKEAPKGSIIFTDLFGGTPSNVAATFSQEFKVISGVNLPMIIEAEMLRSQNNMEKIVEQAMFSATDGIKDISKMMKERMKE